VPLQLGLLLPSFYRKTKKQKKKSDHLFGNPAVSELCRLSGYGSSANNPAKTLSGLNNSHSQVPHLEFKDPWLSAASSQMV